MFDASVIDVYVIEEGCLTSTLLSKDQGWKPALKMSAVEPGALRPMGVQYRESIQRLKFNVVNPKIMSVVTFFHIILYILYLSILHMYQIFTRRLLVQQQQQQHS